jgi:rhamnogalacturonan endolyase
MTLPKLAVCFLTVLLPAILSAAPESSVVISSGENSFTLANGIVTAQVAKSSGDLTSLKYKGLEMLQGGPGHTSSGYWSHNPSRGQLSTRITIDPATNNGALGEVSVKGLYVPGTNSPGGGRFGGFSRVTACDIEIRYALARGSSGVYTYSIFGHQTNYPATGVGEARFCAKLNDDIFDWLTVDSNRNMKVITAYDWNHGTELNFKEVRRMNSGIYKGQPEHKYDYSANQFDVRAWGWSSSGKHIGIWFINPSGEYLSGGPTKFELSAHRDATFDTNDFEAAAPPCLLNYWRSSHYGGSVCSIAQTDAWTKVIGPFLIYCNSGPTPNAMWQDTLGRSTKESEAWPYDWVSGVDYPHRNERGTVTGQLVLNDPQAPKSKFIRLLVGLSAPDYMPPRFNRGPGGFGGFGPAGGGEDDTNNVNRTGFPGGFGRGTNDDFNFTNQIGGADSTNRNVYGFGGGTNFSGSFTNGGFGGRRFGRGGFGPPRIVDWQSDAKYYQFWVYGDAQGDFTIPKVRPGAYTLHAIADGVLGEFAMTNVTVAAGKTLSLGELNWQPVRYGKQLWDIGIPNRTGAEFFKGNDYYHWGWYIEYAKLFPNDVNYVVGKSDFRKDWFFEQVPHSDNPANTDGIGGGRSTSWSIAFHLPDPPHGKATLRLAICGIGARSIEATVNSQSIGSVTDLVYNATINRDGIGGTWCERDLTFDASLMKAGENVMKLTIPAGSLTSGIIYDYLRLELDESAPSPKRAN